MYLTAMEKFSFLDVNLDEITLTSFNFFVFTVEILRHAVEIYRILSDKSTIVDEKYNHLAEHLALVFLGIAKNSLSLLFVKSNPRMIKVLLC